MIASHGEAQAVPAGGELLDVVVVGSSQAGLAMAWHLAQAGLRFPAPADTYPTKDPVADYLQAYAAAFDLPVRLDARVTDLRQTAEGFEVRTADASYRARQVVVATGPFQVPFVPPPAAKLDPR
jgi:putative flavoprotein involved in K+ transport